MKSLVTERCTQPFAECFMYQYGPVSEMTYCVEWDVKLYHTILYCTNTVNWRASLWCFDTVDWMTGGASSL